MASKRSAAAIATPRKRPTVRLRGTMGDGETEQSLWREWTAIFSCGTEWDEQRKLAAGQREIPWDFSHLLHELEKGVLAEAAASGKFVHLFGATEPQTLAWVEEEGAEPVDRLTYIPVIVAIVGSQEAPQELGVNSVQMEKEKEGVYDFAAFKMSWAPFVFEDSVNYDPVHDVSSRIFRLHCNQRLASVKNMKETDAKRFEYCMPYVFNPKMQGEVEVDSEVQVITKFPGVAYATVCTFDWKFDDLQEFIAELLKKEGIEDTKENRDLLEQRIREDVKAAKQRIREEKAARKKRLESMTEEDKKALEEMKLFKFYPCGPRANLPNLPDLMSSYINRYYGRADRIFPPKPAPKPVVFWGE